MRRRPGSPAVPAVAAFVDNEDRAALRAALGAARGNVSATARQLGIPLATLKRRLRALGLQDWVTVTFSRSVRQRRNVMYELHLIASSTPHVNPDETACVLDSFATDAEAHAAGRRYLREHPDAWLQVQGENASTLAEDVRPD